VSFSLAVTLPRAGNIGGGGFMLIHDAATGENTSIDYREMAPLGATRDMYLDEVGDVDRNRAMLSHLSAGVPGTVAGLYHAHQQHGRLPWKRLLESAIAQARHGVRVSFDLAEMLKSRQSRMCQNAATCGYFYKDGGEPYAAGELLIQSDLADTLERIANDGPDGFYKGKTAELIAGTAATKSSRCRHRAQAVFTFCKCSTFSSTFRSLNLAPGARTAFTCLRK
jgi:gamma-glutamyltranspeptidase/glutathione hydrolase